LKVLIVFTTSHANTLGNECRLNLIDHLTSKLDVTILTNQYEFTKERFPNSKILNIGFSPKDFLFFRLLFFWIKLAKVIGELKPDKVFLFHNDAPVAIFLNIPVYQYIHQYGERSIGRTKGMKSKFLDWFYDILTVKGLRSSELNFAISPFLLGYFKAREVQNIVYSPHGIITSRFSNPFISEFHDILKEKRNEGYFLVCYTGWVTENRGLSLMLSSIEKLVAKKIKVALVLCGTDSKSTDKVSQFAHDKGIELNILDLGTIDSSLIPGVIHFSDVCLSLWDDKVPGFNLAPPQKIFEYFAGLKPIICNNIGTHTLYVFDRVNGLVIDYSTNALSQAIEELYSDEELYEYLIVNLKNFSKVYDWEKIYGEVVKQINQN
jgi:glycosyltransferase involved in cell wall biosynthesis